MEKIFDKYVYLVWLPLSLGYCKDDTQELPPEDEVKFLVYKSYLLSLFTACRNFFKKIQLFIIIEL